MKENKSICPTCGANLKGRWEYITEGQLNSLAKFLEAVKDHDRNSIHLQDDLDLTKNEYNNFQKLRYNGLVAHAPEKGCWLITRRGAQFLRNELDLPKGVLIFRNRIQKYHSTRVTLSDILASDDPYWLQKEDYEYETVDIVDYEIDKFDFIEFDKDGQGRINFGEEEDQPEEKLDDNEMVILELRGLSVSEQKNIITYLETSKYEHYFWQHESSVFVDVYNKDYDALADKLESVK
jgi:hypothetical protein